MAGTTGIAALLHENGRTLQSLRGLVADDKYSSEPTACGCSKYGPHCYRTKLLCKSSLIFIDEASMMERRLFEMVDVVLNDLGCQSSLSLRLRFDCIFMVFFADYLQFLPVVR